MADRDTSDPHRLSPAAEAFAHYLNLHEAGDAPPFDDYCAAHSEHAEILRQLHQRWSEVNAALAESDPPPVAVTPAQPRPDQDPEITLRSELPQPRGDRSAASRYSEPDVIARGGMGEIRRVWDTDLRRAIAMKVLRDDAPARGTDAPAPHSDARQLRRFLEEAQITAQLQHPGIVPVHELGLDHHGELYFTMTLVRGRDFKQVLQLARTGAEGWTLTRVLEVLRRVCEAVAYAHDKGVIHRDLKPLNIMVGRFGETYVMDWGLARVLERDTPAVNTLGMDWARSADQPALQTLDGDVVGTPAYMPPEQARGELDRVGPPADVYAIGAMLYEVLAGHLPYVPEGERPSARVVLERLLTGPPEPLQHGPDVPAELVAICNRAMARDPKDRYPSVVDLADDLAAFLELRVVRAYESGTWAALRKWVRRNRALSATAAAAVFALVTGLALTMMQKNRADRQAARADRQAARAEDSFRLAFAAVDRMLSRMGSRLEGVPRAQEVQRDLFEDALTFHNEFLATRGEDPSLRYEVALAQLRAGRLHGKLGNSDRAMQGYQRAHQMLTTLIEEQPDHRQAGWELADAERSIGRVHALRGDHERAIHTLQRAGERAEALATEPDTTREQRATHALILATLGGVLSRSGDHQASLPPVQRAIDLRRGLCTDAPNDADGYARLGEALSMMSQSLLRLRKPGEAETLFIEAGTVLEHAVQLDPSAENLHVAAQNANNYAAWVLSPSKRYDEAELQMNKVRDWAQTLVADFPTVPAYLGLLGGALSNLAFYRRESGDLESSLALLEQAIGIERKALRREPDNKTFQRYLINQLRKLGETLVDLGRPELAVSRAEELAALPFGDGLPRYYASAILATCVPVDAPEGATDGDAALTARALELLALSIDQPLSQRGPFGNPAFRGLRKHPEFLRLRAVYAARSEAAASEGK